MEHNMKNKCLILTIAIFWALNLTAQPVKKHIETEKAKIEKNAEEKIIDVVSFDKNKDGKIFQCPMDWEVLADKSGRCDKCGMNLKEYNVKAAQENLEKYLAAKNKKAGYDHSKMMSKKDIHTQSKAWNSVCPLDGEKVNPKGKTSEFKGKKIGFCCDDCKIAFDKTPEKYLKNISKDGKKFLSKK